MPTCSLRTHIYALRSSYGLVFSLLTHTTTMSPHKGDALLPSSTTEAAPIKRTTSAGLRLVKGLLVGIALWTCLNAAGLARVPACVSDALVGEYEAEAQCTQVSAVAPEKNSELWGLFGETISTDAFKTRAVEWLGGAVRVP